MFGVVTPRHYGFFIGPVTCAYAKTIIDRLGPYEQRFKLAITNWRSVQEAHKRSELEATQRNLAKIEEEKTKEANRLVNLTNTPDKDEILHAWSPDGRYIAYGLWPTGWAILDLESPPGQNNPEFHTTPDGRDFWVMAWSADGQTILRPWRTRYGGGG